MLTGHTDISNTPHTSQITVHVLEYCSFIIDFSPHLGYLQAADVILNALKYVLRLKGIQRKKGALNL